VARQAVAQTCLIHSISAPEQPQLLELQQCGVVTRPHYMTSTLRLPYLLLTSLGLVAGGCHTSSTPAPELALEGDWNLVSSSSTTYSASGAQLAQATVTFPVGNDPAARYYTYTSTTRQLVGNAGASRSGLEPYTRAGNVLTFYVIQSGAPSPVPTGTETITQLTATELTLSSADYSSRPPYDHISYTNRYTRR
jgi:hypothetical protein